MQLPTKDDLTGLLMVLALVLLLACVSSAHCAEPWAVTTDGQSVTETLYRPVGPNVQVPFSAKRAMGLWEPVPVQKTIKQVKAEWELSEQQRRAAEDARGRAMLRWIGLPLLALGALGLILGGYLAIKGQGLGEDLLILAAMTLAMGVVLVLYPRYVGWASAALIGGLVLYAIWRRWRQSRALRAAGETVSALDEVRAAVGEDTWKNAIAPVLTRVQSPPTKQLIHRLQGAAHAAAPR